MSKNLFHVNFAPIFIMAFTFIPICLKSQITLGTQVGVNYSNPKTVIVSEGKTESDDIFVGKPG
jgi:hypothetical protein